jgi:hypothetical protein
MCRAGKSTEEVPRRRRQRRGCGVSVRRRVGVVVRICMVPCSTSQMLKHQNASEVAPFCPKTPQNQALILQGMIAANPNPGTSNNRREGGLWLPLHIQPLRGGLRTIVPAPRGIREVGEFVVGDRDVLEWAGELRPLGEWTVDGEPGETGFILRPLIPGWGGRGACDAGAGDRGIEGPGVGGRIFSRWVCR